MKKKERLIKTYSTNVSPVHSDSFHSTKSQSKKIQRCFSTSCYSGLKKKTDVPTPTLFNSTYTLLADTPPIIAFTQEKRFRNTSYEPNNASQIGRIWLKKSPSYSLSNARRKDVFVGNDNPSPHDYKINTCFDDDVLFHKGYSISPKYEMSKDRMNPPGPGAYKKILPTWKKQYSVKMKSRHFLFFHDYIKGRTLLSPQKYHINYDFAEPGRFKGIGFGIGKKLKLRTNGTPGVGSYNLPSCFDLSRKKTPMN